MQNFNKKEEFFDVLVKKSKKLLLVSGKFVSDLELVHQIKTLPIEITHFDSFESNPSYESVVKGVAMFHQEECDGILAIGGGSAIDVAKCIKLYSTMEVSKNYLKQKPQSNNIPLFAVPTTAGTGSEATKFAVIYYHGKKQTISHISLIPSYVFLYEEMLNKLPIYQRKVTMIDALSHAIESYWSLNSSNESRRYSNEAIQRIMEYKDLYLKNITKGNKEMLYAAHIAGKAINIAQTTAAHAMSYKLTSMFGIAHGHAVGICLPELWQFMYEHTNQCVDIRGENFLKEIFQEIAEVIGCTEISLAIRKLKDIITILDLEIPLVQDIIFPKLIHSVNTVRLKNNPVALSESDLLEIYKRILI